MLQILLILDVVFAVALVALILVQQGKGAAMGASFGAGASQTVFGSAGAGSFMLKLTGFFGLLFFVTSLMLGHMMGRPAPSKGESLLEGVSKISQTDKAQQQAAQKAEAKLNAAAVSKAKKKKQVKTP